MTSSKKYILFDFDGVIADSFGVAWGLNQKICSTLTKERYLDAFDGNVNDWNSSTLSWHSPDCKHTITDWFAEYIPLMKKHVELIPGMDSVIKELEKKYTFIIISSSPTEAIREFLEKNALATYFTSILGNDVHGSKIEKIKMVFAKYAVKAEDCVFVTDTLGDMREARAMSVDSIGISWGYHENERLVKGNPFRIVHRPQDLPSAISDYFEERNQQVS